MDGTTFNKKKRQLNKTYFEVFGVVPCMQGFDCTREEYLDALNAAIKTRTEIEKLLPLAGEPIDKDALI